MKRAFLIGGAAVLGLGSIALAAPATPEDQTFVQQAFLANTSEIREARYVLQNTDNSDARAFATRMIDDHSTANVKLAEAARKAGLHAPEAMVSVAGTSPGGPLTGLTGTKLAATYLNEQIADHRAVLGDLQREEADKKASPELRAYASETVPIVREHLGMAMKYVAEMTPQNGGLSTQKAKEAQGPGSNPAANVAGAAPSSSPEASPSPMSATPAPNPVPTKSPSP